MLLPVIILAALGQILLALFVVYNNPKSATNVLFGLLSATLVAWTSLTFLNNQLALSELTLILVRVTMFFVVLQNSFTYLFSRTFPENNISLRGRWLRFYSGLSILAAVAALSPLLFISVEQQGVALNPIPGPAIPIFVLHAAISVSGSLRQLVKSLKEATNKSLKKQLKLILLAVAILGVVIPFLNFALTLALQTSAFTNTTPIFSLIFSSVLAFAIVSQKLFDIRAAVARSVAYVLSLGFIGLVYGSIIFVIFSFTDLGKISDNAERAVFVALALVTATAYPFTKKYFNKLTTKLFYQDAYDSQEFLDEINTLLVGQIDLEELLRGITDVIETTLKSSYCVFIVRETAYEDVRIVGSENHQFNSEKIKELRSLTPRTHRKVLSTDELGESDSELKKVQDSLDVAVLVRLVSNASLDLEGMGYLVLGPKKNGTIYSAQDRQVLNILANEMIIAVENALRFEEIEKFNVTLQDKVDSATSELQRTNEKLKEIDETKDEFISMASHQLRTPLTSVKGYLSMVLEGDVGKVNKQQNKMLEQAFLSSQRMVYLIADLLNVSRLKTGKFVIDAKETNLADVVEAEVEQLKPTAKIRDLKLNFNKPKNFPALIMDETKIRQVIMNFVDNAIYYTPAKGKINVSLEDKGETIEFKVIDNGIGVPKAERHKLFGKFYRAENARSSRPDGTGLGLFMAKKVVVAQGGAIIFETEEGKGSTFGFSFAKEKLAKLAAELAEAEK